MRVDITAEQMAATFGTDGVIRFAAPHPLVRHAATRDFLREIGLPREAALIRFEAAHESADGLLVIGRFTFYGDRKVYLDGDDGRVYAVGMSDKKPRLLATDLSVLVTFAGLIRQVQAGAVDGGLDETEALLGALLEALGEYDPEVAAGGGETSSFWQISFLAWTTVAPARRVLAEQPQNTLLDFDFGTSDRTCFAPEELPESLTHEPSRRYLQEIGLVETGAYFNMRWQDLRTLVEKEAEEADPEDDEAWELPSDADHLVVIGYAMDDADIVLDGRDGRVFIWDKNREPAELVDFNGDLSRMNLHHWAISRMNRIGSSHAGWDRDGFGAHVLGEALAGFDPVAWSVRDDQWWPLLLLSPENGVIGF